MADRFHGTLYVSNSEMHGDTDWVRASDYDAAQARIRELEALLREWRDVQCDQVMSLRFMRRVDAALASQSDREGKQ